MGDLGFLDQPERFEVNEQVVVFYKDPQDRVLYLPGKVLERRVDGVYIVQCEGENPDEAQAWELYYFKDFANIGKYRRKEPNKFTITVSRDAKFANEPLEVE